MGTSYLIIYFKQKLILQMGSICSKDNSKNDTLVGSNAPNAKGGEVQELNTKADYDNLLNNSGNQLIVVDFFATWCPPCQRIKPQFAELAKQTGGVSFAKVDCDQNK